MGKRKRQIAAMSNSLLMKDRQKKHGHRKDGNDSFLHTTELSDGASYNRINFQSVTEQSNLEDFLTTAEMAGKDFTAERQNIQIITNPGQGIRLTDTDMLKISEAQHTHRALLQIPRRPKWDETTTKEELTLMERDSFTDWRRQLKILEEKEHIQLTPYEKNLDFWRQLWRVIERSDVIVQIVDARNPLLFRCEDLDTYVKQVDSRKTVMLLINKADFLNHQQRKQWVDYFNKEGIRVVFFSAKVEKEKQEGTSELAASPSGRDEDKDMDEYIEEDEDSESRENDENEDESEEEVDKDSNIDTEGNGEDISQVPAGSDCVSSLPHGPSECETEFDRVPLEAALNKVAIGSADSNSVSSPDRTAYNKDSNSVPENKEHSKNHNDLTDSSLSVTELIIDNSVEIKTADELLDIFHKLAHPSSSARDDGVKTIGMVGYPNVGKSSTINVILNQKRLAVSATPGRTKHLQTLYVDEHLMLCDCPGLVFPSFVATKAHLVINGILPIDEMRDHVSPINLICDHIPRNVLEATYSIMIPRPSMDDNPNRVPTAEELLNAYGAMRGFMTPRGVPDGPRAARYILKDYVKGKLLYCEPPPGVSGPEFQDMERITALETLRPHSKVPPPQIRSDIDKEFFAKKSSKAHSRGKMGVSDFVRVDTLQHVSRASEARASDLASASSHTSLSSVAGKSWKKHNNRNKKEKLRRLHKDLDLY